MKAQIVGFFSESRPWKALIVGGVYVVFAFIMIRTVWTSKSELIPIKGLIRSAENYVETVTDNRGHSSQRAELIVYLDKIEQKYRISRNIGSDNRDKEYEHLRRQLNRSDSATIWIRKTELREWAPKVFQIDADHKTVLDFDTVRLEHRWVGIFLLLGGIALILLFIFPPKKVNR